MVLSLMLKWSYENIISSCNFSTSKRRNQVNFVFWFCLIFTVSFQLYAKLLNKFLRASRVVHHKWKVTVLSSWTICFHAVVVVFLIYYEERYLSTHSYFKRNGETLTNLSESLLIYTPKSQCSLLHSINLIILSFYVAHTLHDLNEWSVSDAVNKTLICGLIVCFNSFRLDYFAIKYNLLISIFELFTNALTLLSCYVPKRNDRTLRVLVSLKLFVWSYIFLNLFPTKYLIPTFYDRHFFCSLNVLLWVWYGASVWNSPLLKCFHHRIYHRNMHTNAQCGGSLTRCILTKSTLELYHSRRLRTTVSEVQFAEKSNRRYSAVRGTDSPATAYQTIKCVIALKRKLKRIRENAGAKRDAPEAK